MRASKSGPLLEDVAVEPQPGSERGAHGAS
jgi:hypothetical protein